MYRFAGGVLLTVAAVILFAAPDSPGYDFVGLVGFVACLLAGVFLLTGMAGTPADVRHLRRHARDPTAKRVHHIANLAPREFRYDVGLASRAVMVVLALSMIGMGIAIFVLFGSPLIDHRPAGMEPWEAIAWTVVDSGIPIVGGVLLLLYVHRFPGINIRVDRWGLRARTLLGRVEIPWRDIVALKQGNAVVPVVTATALVVPLGTIYRVYSLDRKLEFSHSLEGAADLIALIEMVTGLQWN